MNDTSAAPLEVRCADGVACLEVVDRLAAADLAEYELGERDAADRLRATAARFAEIHRYGTDDGGRP